MAHCVSCGQPLPDGAQSCPACGVVIGAQAGETPAGVAPAGAGGQPGPVYASLGDRALGVLLDVLPLFGIFWATGMLLSSRFGGLTAQGFELRGWPAVVIFSVSVLLFLLYCFCFEWWFGATLGKLVAGIAVQQVEGTRLQPKAALIRNLVRIIDAVGVYLVGAVCVLATKRRQRLGDVAAGTIVVRREYPRAMRLGAVVVLLLVPVAAVAGTWSLRQTASDQAVVGASTPAPPAVSTPPPVAQSGGERAASAEPSGTAGSAVLRPVSDGPLVMSSFKITNGHDGPERPSATFVPGEIPTVSFEVTGTETEAEGTGHVRLIISAFDPDGVPINETKQTETRPPASAKRLASWANVSLPDYATPGVYRLEVAVEDLVANRKVAISMPFVVEGRSFQPSDTLVVRHFRLTEGEDGPPRDEFSYRAGETVWMAFDLVGFKHDAEHRIQIRERLRIVSADGERQLDMQVLDLNRAFFYVPRRLPVTNNVRLGTMPPGEYQATLVFDDGVGKQHLEHQVRFTIKDQ